jgi:hypothetical protein
MTFRITGQVRVTVGGVEITCDEGGNIEIKSQESLPEGSKRSDSEYERENQVEDHRS